MTDPTTKLPTLAEVLNKHSKAVVEFLNLSCLAIPIGVAKDLAAPYDALIASQAEEIVRLKEAIEEREGDIHLRVRAGYDTAIADTWRALVAEKDAEIAQLKAENAELRKETQDRDGWRAISGGPRSESGRSRQRLGLGRSALSTEGRKFGESAFDQSGTIAGGVRTRALGGAMHTTDNDASRLAAAGLLLPPVLSLDDVRAALGKTSRQATLRLRSSAGLPLARIGRGYFITRPRFTAWLDAKGGCDAR